MTASINMLIRAVTTQLAAVLSRTASSVTAAFDVSSYEGPIEFTLAAGAATVGSSPTLDVKITHCATAAGSYSDVTGGAFTQVTTTAGVQTIVVDKNALHQFVEVSWTIGGTSTPTFPFGIIAKGFHKYA